MIMEEVLDFSFNEKGRDNFIHQKHYHNTCYEVIHIINGEGSVVLKDKIYPMKNNCIYFINGMDIHYTAPNNPAQYVRSKILINSDFVENVAESTDCHDLIKKIFIQDGGICIELNEKENEIVDKEFKKMSETLKNGSYKKLNIAISLFNIFQYARNHNEEYVKPKSDKISEVLEYINKNIEKKISLDDICKNVHISKYYLCHTFKKSTQISIYDYILSRRISMAKKRLIYTDMTISEIALCCGFSSFAYFSKAFKEAESLTPKQYRKNYSKHE